MDDGNYTGNTQHSLFVNQFYPPTQTLELAKLKVTMFTDPALAKAVWQLVFLHESDQASANDEIARTIWTITQLSQYKNTCDPCQQNYQRESNTE